jgi:signal transduction histidine kinase
MAHLSNLGTTLQLRLLGTVVLGVLVSLASVAVVARWAIAAEFQQYVDTTRLDLQLVAKQVAQDTGKRLLVTDVQGAVVVDSSQALTGTLLPAAGITVGTKPPFPPVLETSDIIYVRQAGPGSLALDPAFPDVPLPLQTPFTAPMPRPEDLFINSVNRSLVFGVLIGGGVAVALSLTLARRILGPIGALTAAARKLEQGDLSQRVTTSSRDELGQLACAFNAMAEALARTEHLRRTMVTDVAHELRTPLTNLRGYLEAIRDGLLTPGRDAIESLYEEALLLGRLVDDLHELAISEAGRLRLDRAPVALAGMLVSATRAIQARSQQQGVALEIDLPPTLPCVDVDARRIGQVLRNLLGNALTHTPAGGAIVVSASVAADEVTVRIRDTGAGIAADHLPYVFERFYRADPSRSRATGGAGLGLAIAKHLVEAHGGRVGIDSALHRGTTVSFTLPAAA